MPRTLQPCGTVASYRRHRAKGETPCEECLVAGREYLRKKTAQYRSENPEWYRRINRESNRKRTLEGKIPTSKERNERYANRPDLQDKARKRSAEWKKRNPRKAKRSNHFNYIYRKDKYRNYERARRARKYGVGHHAYNLQQVLERYGVECWVCHTDIDLSLPRIGHKTMGLHLDHLIPLIKGGHDKLGNIRPTHGVCNLRKGESLLRVNLLAK